MYSLKKKLQVVYFADRSVIVVYDIHVWKKFESGSANHGDIKMLLSV